MDLFHPQTKDINIEDVLYALGDKTRLRIVCSLYAADRPLSCTEAVKGIKDLPLSSRSHAIKILRDRGVIRTYVQGREHYNVLRMDELELKYPGIVPTILQTLASAH